MQPQLPTNSISSSKPFQPQNRSPLLCPSLTSTVSSPISATLQPRPSRSSSMPAVTMPMPADGLALYSPYGVANPQSSLEFTNTMPSPAFQPTPEQQAIQHEIASASSSLMISAYAGTAKS